MSTYNVSSMIGFIEAWERASGGDVIEVLADLHYDDVYDIVTSTISLNGGTAVADVTINGNNHAIYNIANDRVQQSGAGRIVFGMNTSSTDIKINSLSFLNCNMGANGGAIISGSTGTTIYNSVVQGRFKSSCFYGGCTVKDSMITFDHCMGRTLSTTSANTSPKWSGCWIKFIDCAFTADSSYYATNLNTCYLEGTLGVTSSSDDPKMFNNVNDSCINITGFFHSPTIPNFCKYSVGSPSIINCTKLTSIHPLTEADSTTNVKIVTDEHMKDAEYLADIGFNIIP